MLTSGRAAMGWVGEEGRGWVGVEVGESLMFPCGVCVWGGARSTVQNEHHPHPWSHMAAHRLS
jgi:hypothetical protein